MLVNKILSTPNETPSIKSAKNVSFCSSKNQADEMFDKYAVKKLPEGKAIQVVKKPGIGKIILNTLSTFSVILGGFGFFGKITHPDLKLVDIDPNNLTKKQQKLIRRGKLINYLPSGYHIEGDKVKKNK